MRIAFITQPWDVVWPKDDGGGSSIPMLTYKLAHQMKNLKNEVVIFSKQIHLLPPEETDEWGIIHRRIDLAFEDKLMRLLNHVDRFQLLRWVRRPLWSSSMYYFGYIRQIGGYLKQWNPDIVHIHNFSQFVSVIRQIVPNARIVLHMHCEWLTELNAGMIRRRLRQTNLVLGCSKYITRKIHQRFPESSDCCQTLFNGADFSQFSSKIALESPKKNSKTLLFVGRLSPEKGVHLLLDAFGIVLIKFPDACLQIVGGIGSIPPQFEVAISDDKRVQDLARFYNFPPSKSDYYYQQLFTRLPANKMQKVSFLGHIPYTHMQDIYRNADIFINSALFEPFGLPILEAMASGLPVVASKVGGVSELVRHGETGLLFQPGNPDSLAEAIIRLLEDEELCQCLRTRATQEIKEGFSWESLTEELLLQYQSLYTSR